jgi:hypothetical protein
MAASWFWSFFFVVVQCFFHASNMAAGGVNAVDAMQNVLIL